MNTEWIRLEAHAKINLSLDVLRKREDGYHEVRMIMQSLGLCDEVWMRACPEDGISLSPYGGEVCPGVPYDEKNLMYRAAALMKERFGIREGVELRLLKRIPSAAGLAGGSADAAAVILGMNELFDIHAGFPLLSEVGLSVGADVPYCLMGGTALAEGIGERLTKLPPAPMCQVLLVKPEAGISTREVYESLRVNERPAEAHPDIDGVMSALQGKNFKKLATRMGNILELAALPMVPEIETIRKALLSMGAVAALMSGSGPTVFGLYTDADSRHQAAEAFREGSFRGLAKDVIETEFYRFTAL